MSWFPSKMERLDVIVANQHRDNLLSRLHELGIVEIRDVKKDENISTHLSRPEPHAAQKELEAALYRINRISSILERAAPEKEASIRAMLSPTTTEKVPVQEKSAQEILKETKDFLSTIENYVIEADKEHEKLSQELEVLKARYHAVSMLLGLDMDLSSLGRGPFVFVTAGMVSDPARLNEALSPFKVILQTSPAANNLYAAVVVGLSREEKTMLPMMKTAGFSPLELSGERGGPRQVMESLAERTSAKSGEINAALNKIRSAREEYHTKLEAIQEQLAVELERVHAVQKSGCTYNTHVLSFWCPSRKKHIFEKAVEKASKGTGIIHRMETEEEPPTHMDNHRWAKPFEMLTKMYGTPAYSEVDPTKIIAPVFIIFFGLMLGDAVYGLMVALAGAVMMRASGEDQGMKDFSVILFLSGISAVIFGIIQGGYLGPVMPNQPNIIMFMGITPHVVLDAMTDPITLLVIALLVGLAYINVGLFLAMVQNIKAGKPKKIMLEQAPWWLLQPAGFILLGEGLFGWWSFTPMVQTLGMLMAVGGVLLLVASKKGLFFFDITGFLGNFLSFARILALGLATAGIALTINVIVDLVAGADIDLGPLAIVVLAASLPIAVYGVARKKAPMAIAGAVGASLGGLSMVGEAHLFFFAMAAIMYVVAHIMNCGLQTLGAFIHSLRLQYVEFFGLFFEGAGRQFKPFRPERKRTILVKEETT